MRHACLVIAVSSLVALQPNVGAQHERSGDSLLEAQVASDQAAEAPQMIMVPNDGITLRALVWRPNGSGPFPAILLNHGSGRTREDLERFGPYEQNAAALGPMFARHGYVFMYLFRRGVGLSAEQGPNAIDLMNREQSVRGQEGRNELQLQLLEGREMRDALAALSLLRTRADVDARNVGLVGHSLGGSLTILMAAREPTLRAAVVFSASGYSWDVSPPLRARLLAAVGRSTAPLFFIHAKNDYSIGSGEALDEELRRLNKKHRFKLYDAIGKTPEDGHEFLYLGISSWEADVFAFLDAAMRK